MRLNKFLSLCGISSRRKSDELIKEGRVVVNGSVLTTLGLLIDPKKDEVMVDGVKLSAPSSFVYYKLNKPRGYICSASDDRGRKTIYDLLDIKERVFSIGRLDYDTEGLIILTNDGDFANKVMHPAFHIEKEYWVTVEGKMQESELAVLRKGVVVDGVRMPPAKVKFLEGTLNVTKLSVVINEGQNRQIRRMFEAIGRSIKLLKRVRIGALRLGGLKRGESKEMSKEEAMLLLEER